MLAGSYGLWTLQPWGRQINMALALACIPFCLMTLAGVALTNNVTTTDRVVAVADIVLAFAIWRYLASNGIKQRFDGHAEGSQ